MSTTIKTGKTETTLKLMNEINSTIDALPDSIRQYVKGFYNSMRNSSKTASPQTHKVYINSIILFLNAVNKPITKITLDDITGYIADISVKPDGNLASGSYLVAVYSALKKFFRYAYVSKKITEDPMVGVERPAPKKAYQVERTFLTKKEIEKIFSCIDKEQSIWKYRDKAIFTLFLSTGIRETCLTEINISNIDFENNCIYVLDKGTKAKQCYLPEDKMDSIKEWIEIREEIIINSKQNIDTDALFISRQLKRIAQSTIKDLVRKYSSMIGHEISPHKLRGTFATMGINSGLSLYEVSRLMNHSSTAVTAACYVQGQDEKIKEAGLKVANLF